MEIHELYASADEAAAAPAPAEAPHTAATTCLSKESGGDDAPRTVDRVYRGIGAVRDAAAAALDFIDRNCDEFLDPPPDGDGADDDDEGSSPSGALGPVLRRMSVDGGDADADADELRSRLWRRDEETRALAEVHARTAAELARKTADVDDLRSKLGALDEKRRLGREEAAANANAVRPPTPAEDEQRDGFVRRPALPPFSFRFEKNRALVVGLRPGRSQPDGRVSARAAAGLQRRQHRRLGLARAPPPHHRDSTRRGPECIWPRNPPNILDVRMCRHRKFEVCVNCWQPPF